MGADAGALVGAYGDNFIDRNLLVGGAAYVLQGTQGVSMAYGGGLMEWFGNPGGLIEFSLRGFVGLGTAALSSGAGFSAGCGDAGGIVNDDLSGIANDGGWGTPIQPCWTGAQSITAGAAAVDNPGHGQGNWDTGWPGWPFDLVPHRQNFLLAEPQASIHLNVTPWLRIGGGAGYRLIAGDTLTASVSYSGGCRAHVFTAAAKRQRVARREPFRGIRAGWRMPIPAGGGRGPVLTCGGGTVA